MEQSSRFGLPFMISGQAQREITHNEALISLDVICQCVVLSKSLTSPPPQPNGGECWIVADGGQGEWAEKDRSILSWTEGGWRTVQPVLGMKAWVVDEQIEVRFDGQAWHAAGLWRLPAGSVAVPTGGMTVDAEVRTAFSQLIDQLRSVGLLA